MCKFHLQFVDATMIAVQFGDYGDESVDATRNDEFIIEMKRLIVVL